MTRLPDSPFDVLDDAFALLTAEPHPLAVNGPEVGPGLPARDIPLGELKARLLHPSCRYATRDAALDLLLAQARAHGGAWTVGLAGVLLPGLRAAAAPLIRACPGKAADLEAEMLAGLVKAIARTAPGRSRPAAHLTWAARHAAERLLRIELAERGRPDHRPVSAEPPRPFGHPDFILVAAADAEVISSEDAELIGATRLGELSLAEAAARLGCSYTAARLRRKRAEVALVAWIRDRAGEFEPNRRQTPGSKGVGRTRQGRPRDRRPELCHHPDLERPAS